MRKVGYLSLVIWMLAGCDQLVDQQMDSVYGKVASDAVEQYEIAKRQGDPMQVCVQAGLVSAAYLQAKDENKYRLWKSTEKADCALAGVY